MEFYMTDYILFPAVDAEYNFPPEILAKLAQSLELRNSVLPMTQATRDNLTGDDLWVGRAIFNLTTNVLQIWIGTGDEPWQTYVPLAEVP